MPLRVFLAWVVGTLGVFTPFLIRTGFDSFNIILWQLLLFPFELFIWAFLSGWWSFVAIPLLFAFCWRVLVFLRDEGSTSELFWLFILPFLIGIRGSGNDWPLAAFLAGFSIFFVIKLQLTAKNEP
jgi:hypothetical protein